MAIFVCKKVAKFIRYFIPYIWGIKYYKLSILVYATNLLGKYIL